MMERDWERTEFLLETARQRPRKSKVAITSPTLSKWKSIHQKLVELYVEECSREPRQDRLRNASHLLDKLIAREKISCLVVNLYAGNEGYSVMLKGRNGADTETVRLPYEEAELLQYIDNEELPPVLVDILECSQINIFYSGCVVAEVRDYRRSTSPSIYEAHHVLLRPSMQTLICDVNSITNDGNKWTHEDKMALESNLLLATQEPLCLEPSVTVTLVSNYLQYSRHKFNVTPIKSMAKKYSQTAINRKWKFEQHAAPPNLQLYDFLSKHKDKQRSPLVNLRMNKNISETWKPSEVKLEPPETVEVENFAKCIPPNEISNENVLDLVEKYTLESKQGNGKGYYCQLSIYLRSLDDRFIGHLYTDRDYVEGLMKGAMCRFELGSRSDVDRYLHQFIEIFIQESRKTVKITHEVKGQGATVTSVPGGQSIAFPLQNNSTMQPLDHCVQQQNASQPSPDVITTSPAVAAHTTSEMNTSNTNLTTVNSQLGAGGKRTGPHTTAHLSNVSPGLSITSSGFIFSSPPVSKPTLPALKPSTTASNLGSADSVSSTSSAVNIPATVRRSQPPESVSTLSLVGIPSGLTGLISTGEQVSKLTGIGVSSGIALPITVAMVSPSQPSLIATSARAVVSSAPNVMGETSTIPGTQTLPITVTNEVSSSAIMVTSGMSPISSVITAPGGVVSFPVAISGGIGTPNVSARFIASNINPPGIGIQAHRANTVGLLQVTGPQLLNTGPGVSWPSGNGSASPQSVQTSTPPPAGTTPPPSIASVGPTLITVPSNFNQPQLHVVHQTSSPAPANNASHPSTANKLKRKRNNVTSPK